MAELLLGVAEEVAASWRLKMTEELLLGVALTLADELLGVADDEEAS